MAALLLRYAWEVITPEAEFSYPSVADTCVPESSATIAMKDQVHIRNSEAADLARTLARQTGKTISDLVLDALRHYRLIAAEASAPGYCHALDIPLQPLADSRSSDPAQSLVSGDELVGHVVEVAADYLGLWTHSQDIVTDTLDQRALPARGDGAQCVPGVARDKTEL
jgi:hypothetical protein